MFEASISVQRVIEQMNKAGKSGVPFFFALDYELQEAIFWSNPLEMPPPVEGLSFRVSSISCGIALQSDNSPQIIGIQAEAEEVYSKRFNIVYQGLLRGDSFLTNLTLRTPIELYGSLSDIYKHTSASYQVLYPGRFVCFSPERFVSISREGNIATFPMKGTIDASIPNADTALLNDYKEEAEHYTIVDLMRNDLNRISERVEVECFKYLDRLQTNRGDILQMSSKIVGRLGEGWQESVGSLLLALLPAGSISGAPKEKTCSIIKEAEGIARGFYTGICGYFDGESLDSGVLIRYIEQEGNQFFYRSGGGITINSKMHEEYLECLQKIYLPLRQDL